MFKACKRLRPSRGIPISKSVTKMLMFANFRLLSFTNHAVCTKDYTFHREMDRTSSLVHLGESIDCRNMDIKGPRDIRGRFAF